MKFQRIIACLLFIISIYFQANVYAQSDSSNNKKSYFKASANYLSNAVYSGRKDSSVVSYLSPSIGYFHKSGVYVNGSMSFLANSADAGRIDEMSLGAGYDFSIKDNFDGGFYAEKYFYSNSSYAVTSELQGDAGTYFSYNTGALKLGGGADFLISTNIDFTLNGNLSHPFSFGDDNNTWTISPTAEVNAGTQSFYRSYYKNRKFNFSSGSKGKGHNTGKNNTNSNKVISFPQQNHFSILDYEFLIPVTYDAKKWGIFATPTLAIPENPATYAVDGILQKENLSTSFYVKVGAYIKF